MTENKINKNKEEEEHKETNKTNEKKNQTTAENDVEELLKKVTHLKKEKVEDTQKIKQLETILKTVKEELERMKTTKKAMETEYTGSYDFDYHFNVCQTLNNHIIELENSIKSEYYNLSKYLGNYKNTEEGFPSLFKFFVPQFLIRGNSLIIDLSLQVTPSFQISSLTTIYPEVFEVSNFQWTVNEYDCYPLLQAFKKLNYNLEENQERLEKLKSMLGDIESKLGKLLTFWEYPLKRQYDQFMSTFFVQVALKDVYHKVLMEKSDIRKTIPFSFLNIKFSLNPFQEEYQNSLHYHLDEMKKLKKWHSCFDSSFIVNSKPNSNNANNNNNNTNQYGNYGFNNLPPNRGWA
mmetsp:Transcript_11589/g.17139  ORF Transcript_11589/g.17139 Transcript_11589/m.17139 type:complete len:349 (-) Transcript_11589:361-1407(-)